MAGSGRRQADLLLAGHLAAGLPHAQAAQKTGISERTVRRRLDDPKFRKLVDELKAEAVGRAVSVLGRSMSGAAVELAKLLKSEDEKTRLQASKAIIELGMKGRQHADLERRLEDVEAVLKGEGTGDLNGAIDAGGETGAETPETRPPNA